MRPGAFSPTTICARYRNFPVPGATRSAFKESTDQPPYVGIFDSLVLPTSVVTTIDAAVAVGQWLQLELFEQRVNVGVIVVVSGDNEPAAQSSMSAGETQLCSEWSSSLCVKCRAPSTPRWRQVFVAESSTNPLIRLRFVVSIWHHRGALAITALYPQAARPCR
ncbi:MAG: hypothetical protein ACI9EF_001869 [Pseudohongiellaceae bacterium]|jgi:hypothetical protein